MLPIGRQVGVAVPQNQSTEEAPTMTVTNVAPIQFLGIEYGDQSGRKRTTIGMVIGQKVYELPNGEAIAAQMATFVSAISKQILDKVELSHQGKTNGSVPKTDIVDIMPAIKQTDDELVELVEKKAKAK